MGPTEAEQDSADEEAGADGDEADVVVVEDAVGAEAAGAAAPDAAAGAANPKRKHADVPALVKKRRKDFWSLRVNYYFLRCICQRAK